MYLTADIPLFKAYVRDEFLHDMDSGHGSLTEVIVHAIVSRPGEALGFHVLANNGGQFYGLPIHALCLRPEATRRSLPELELWDCFTWNISVCSHDLLDGLRVVCRLGDGSEASGRYLFSVDWYGKGFSDMPDERKQAHVCALDEGNLCALPNNRILFREASFVTEIDDVPDWKTNTHRWTAESEPRHAESSGRFFYEMEPHDNGRT